MNIFREYVLCDLNCRGSGEVKVAVFFNNGDDISGSLETGNFLSA